jgi:molybdopterin synthase sulfur carrier subunit
VSVKVRVHPYFQPFTGNRELVESTGRNVAECIDNLEAQFPGIKEQLGKTRHRKFELFSYIEVYVNDESAYPDELAKPLNDGDEVSLVVMMLGG